MQIGFPGLLTLIFVTLKLTDFIDWSWWWVLSPLWISSLLFIVIASTIFVMSNETKRVRK